MQTVKEPMAGLYLREKLSYDLSKYRMPQKMKEMLRRFREEKLLDEIDDEEYARMIAESEAFDADFSDSDVDPREVED